MLHKIKNPPLPLPGGELCRKIRINLNISILRNKLKRIPLLRRGKGWVIDMNIKIILNGTLLHKVKNPPLPLPGGELCRKIRINLNISILRNKLKRIPLLRRGQGWVIDMNIKIILNGTLLHKIKNPPLPPPGRGTM
jgi:hypothetical protein